MRTTFENIYTTVETRHSCRKPFGLRASREGGQPEVRQVSDASSALSRCGVVAGFDQALEAVSAVSGGLWLKRACRGVGWVCPAHHSIALGPPSAWARAPFHLTRLPAFRPSCCILVQPLVEFALFMSFGDRTRRPSGRRRRP